MTKRDKKGFTLIELLVVIAIIAILAAILFPVFAQARSKARQAMCLSNMKQIGLSVMQYVQDYEGRFPSFFVMGPGNYGSATWNQYGWFMVLAPYLKNYKILQCPSRNGDGINLCTNGGRCKENFYDTVFESICGGPGRCNEWHNNYPVASLNPPNRCTAATDASIKSPANIICVFEEARNIASGDCNSGFYGQFFGKYSYGTPVECLHSGGMNFIFCDGHAKWYNMTDHPAWNAPTGVEGATATWPSRQISFDVAYEP